MREENQIRGLLVRFKENTGSTGFLVLICMLLIVVILELARIISQVNVIISKVNNVERFIYKLEIEHGLRY
ncbi:MAG: hypothetical protein NC923_02395 [Candidatus Omnitrophica bacterium]|nr:hypothetical protein [Candidatus Omnitrophota bacterium]